MDWVQYHVRIREPSRHLIDVEMSFRASTRWPTISMPGWTPGSYLLREFGRQVQGLHSSTHTVQKIEKATWRFEAEPGERVDLAYTLYAHELTVRTPHVDDSHAFLTGAAVFLLVSDQIMVPVRVSLELPEDWTLYTTLDPASEGAQSQFVANSYDELADSIFEAGSDLAHVRFEVHDTPHDVVLWGAGNYDLDRLAADIPRLVKANAELFGGLPYDRYLFVVLVSDDHQGGLEHSRGTALAWRFHDFEGDDYNDFLQLVSHEHFHVWNVKRIRPRALVEVDYLRENYTRELWAMEGVTSYFDRRHVLRAGLITPATYLEGVAKQMTRLARVPGRLSVDLETSSLDTWIKLYRPTEHSPNNNVSYYLKGSLATLALDLALRRETHGARSYETVMRRLWKRYQVDAHGFGDDELKALIVEVGGEALGGEITTLIERPGEIDYDVYLEVVGLEVEWTRVAKSPDDFALTSLGISTSAAADGRISVKHVYDGGPNAGGALYPGDEISALAGWQVRADTWKNVVRMLPEEGKVSAAVFRRRRLHHIEVNLSEPLSEAKIVVSKNVSKEQETFRSVWLFGQELT